jgi:hypothetical protein
MTTLLIVLVLAILVVAVLAHRRKRCAHLDQLEARICAILNQRASGD